MIGVRDEYAPRFGRQELTLWSGSQYEGFAWELPRHDGYMIELEYRGRVRVACESPRTEANYQRVDAAISAAVDELVARDRC
jgi:hypothetical protein